jgi:hypothetical protein
MCTYVLRVRGQHACGSSFTAGALSLLQEMFAMRTVLLPPPCQPRCARACCRLTVVRDVHVTFPKRSVVLVIRDSTMVPVLVGQCAQRLGRQRLTLSM